MDKQTQKSKGYGFVTFKGMDSAAAALESPEKMIDVGAGQIARDVWCLRVASKIEFHNYQP